MNWRLLGNSIAVSALTTLLACTLGFAAALWLAGLRRTVRKAVLVASIAALMLPPFLATNCWIHLLGVTGAWRGWLPLNIYSLGGVVWILGLMYWPITLLLLLSAWEKLEPSYFEVDPALSGASLLRWLLWPAGRPALAQAALITFVLSLNHFAVPAILQVKVFPAEIWLKLSTELNYAAAWAMSAPLILASLTAVLLLRSRATAWPRRNHRTPADAVRRQAGPGLFRAAAAVTILAITAGVILPLAQILSDAKTWRELPKIFAATAPLAGNSFFLAAGAASVCILAGICFWRFHVGWAAWILFLAPGVLIGTGMIYVFNRPALDVVYHSMAVVVIAFVCRFAALNWQGAREALGRVDRDLVEAARLDAASRWQVFWTAYWPQTSSTFAAVWYVTYLLCLWEVETLVMIYPPGGETLSLRIFNLLHYGHIPQVNALCLLLLALAVLPLVLWPLLTRKWSRADGGTGGAASTGNPT